MDELVPVSDEESQMSAMLKLAIEEKVPVETMEKLVSLSERVSERRARSEFHEAMTHFQADCPGIPRAALVDYTTSKGTRVRYSYADLQGIAKIVRPILNKYGLSFTWDSEEKDGKIRVTCILRHIGGHSESSTFSCPVSQSDRMSASQNMGSAATVGRRQSLVSVLGLTDVDVDDDGEAGETITESQAADIRALMEEVKADTKKFLKLYGVEKLTDLPASMYAAAVGMLEEKRKAQR